MRPIPSRRRRSFPKFVNAITNDWVLSWFANYQSGAFLTPPTSTVNLNYQTSEDLRVAGQPLYTPGVSINNLKSYNPYYTQVLNPNAWAPCPTNGTCMAAGNFIKSFRAPRTPEEDANFGRNFRIKERMNLQIRGEFVNILNRLSMPAPITTNPQSSGDKELAGNPNRRIRSHQHLSRAEHRLRPPGPSQPALHGEPPARALMRGSVSERQSSRDRRA